MNHKKYTPKSDLKSIYTVDKQRRRKSQENMYEFE